MDTGFKPQGVEMLVDTEKNIVIFPLSRLDRPWELPNGSIDSFSVLPAMFPIELNYPYTNHELADKIEYAMSQCNCHPTYVEKYGENVVYEAKYYKVRSFKQAIQGKRMITLGWHPDPDKRGKYDSASLLIPLRNVYAYIRFETINLYDATDWIDLANAVIELINVDITTLPAYKTYKKRINI